MTSLTARHAQPDQAASESDSINLYKLGMLFVVKCRYWSCRAGNDPDELDLTPDRIDARAIASFGTKDLLDPYKAAPTPIHAQNWAPITQLSLRFICYGMARIWS